MRSITTALLLLVTARSTPTEEYEIPAGKTIKTVSTYEPTASEESTPTHSERVGRLPACETELVFPCDVQKIYLEKFVDDSEEQLTLEDLEQMNKAIEEIYADPKEQDEIFNALDLLVDQKSDEVLAFGLNVLNGDVELADESLMYAVNGDAIWDKEVKLEDTTAEEPVVTEEIIIVTEDAEGLEMTDAPVEPEQKQSYLAPNPQTEAPEATKFIPSFTMDPTYTQGSFTTYPTFTQGSYTTYPTYTQGTYTMHPTYAQEPIPARTYKPYFPNTLATYPPVHATYAPVHASYAPIPQMHRQTPKNTVGASSKRHVASTRHAKTAKRSKHTPSYAKSKKQLKATNNVWQPTEIGTKTHHETNYATGAPRTYTHKTHSPVATFTATIPPQTAGLPAYPGFYPTPPTAHVPRYTVATVAPIDSKYETYPSATPLPYPAEPVYPEPLYEGAALPLYHTANGNSEKPITGTGN